MLSDGGTQVGRSISRIWAKWVFLNLGEFLLYLAFQIFMEPKKIQILFFKSRQFFKAIVILGEVKKKKWNKRGVFRMQ